MVPISYSVGHEYLHHILADYKRAHGRNAEAAAEQVGAILSRFLERHEGCVARSSGVDRFGLVTAVPSSDAQRDGHHPLRRIVGEMSETRDRHERLLRRTAWRAQPRTFDSRRYRAVRRLDGESVLLIDDTWTTGASAQSAAAALKAVGAAVVAAVVVGRHVNREWHENDVHLDALLFDWSRCAACAETAERAADATAGNATSSPAAPLEEAA
jgi:adenine/guanine phosphoribosyltransferase-like PRPP-binding protein